MKERSKAKETYNEAVARGETAGLLEQLAQSSDVFGTRLGNVPAGESVHVEITYVGEIKHDAEADGIRFTLPTTIAPRYGTRHPDNFVVGSGVSVQESGGISITVDASVAKGSFIRGVQSPTHPIAVTLGNVSTSGNTDPVMHQASATLSLASSELDRDFVLIIQTKENGTPKAIMETHPSIAKQRALMVTLVPNFSLPPTRPEIVFIVDRSGSMRDKIPALKLALKVFLKSLPVGVKFNICSFGSAYSFLWEKSRTYNRERLEEALFQVERFGADFGGTETFSAIEATVKNRLTDLPCELMLLTDGQISNQTEVFSYLNKEVTESQAGIRVFTLGIGSSVSHALVEGIARAGNGFSQIVGGDEKLDKKVVRMLKGALSPHLTDCKLEIKYEAKRAEEDDYEMVDDVTDNLKVLLPTAGRLGADQKPISIFDAGKKSNEVEIPPSADNALADPYSQLPTISTPKLFQTPSIMPPLFPFSRTVVYLLLSEKTVQEIPKAVILRAKCAQSPLELEIPVELASEPGQTIHQLAARKAIQELEEGRGWIFDSRDQNGDLIKDRFPGRFDEMVEREAVRLGTQFQVSGRWLAFVAVSENNQKSLDADERVYENISNWTTDTEVPHVKCFKRERMHSISTGSKKKSSSGNYGEMVSRASVATGPFSAQPMMGIQQQQHLMAVQQHSQSVGIQQHSQQTAVQQQQQRMAVQQHSPSVGIQQHLHQQQIGRFRECSTIEQPLLPKSLESGQSSFGSGLRTSHSYRRISPPDQLYGSRGSQTPAEPSDSEKLHALIELQNFEGSWTFSDRLADITGVGKDEFARPEAGTAWVTVLVIAFLEFRMREERDVWELVVAKARFWLDTQFLDLNGLEEEGRRIVMGV